MIKKEIKENDILVFRNGMEHTYTKLDRWLINKFYDDNLHSCKDSEYDIVSIKRPYYTNIIDENNDIHYMTRLELETELIERRLQVQSLIHEIQIKNKYLQIYSNYLNKEMEENSKKKTLKKVK